MTQTTVRDLCDVLEPIALGARLETDGAAWRFDIGSHRVYTEDDDRRYVVVTAMYGRRLSGEFVAAMQPTVTILLLAKLREAQRLVRISRQVLRRLELDWHHSELVRDLTAFDLIEVP